MVGTAQVKHPELAKGLQRVSSVNPLATYTPAVAEVKQKVWAALAAAVITTKMAKQTLAAAVVVAVQAAPASSSSASIRRRQHEIRNDRGRHCSIAIFSSRISGTLLCGGELM